MFWIPVAVAVIGIKWALNEAMRERPPPPSPPLQPEPIVTLVGAASAGKSSLGNRLLGQPFFRVGIEHGTTKRAETVPFREGCRLRDTPGLLDSGSPDVLDMTRDAVLVIYVTSGQLLRPELEAIRRVRRWQMAETMRGARERHTVLFCNKADTRHGRMPPADVVRIEDEVLRQMDGVIPSDFVVFGSTLDPYDAGVTRLSSIMTQILNI